MRIYRYVGSFLLGAALIAPAGMLAGTNFQDDRHPDDKQRARDDKNQKRYYDRNHKDYHTWDDREGRESNPVAIGGKPAIARSFDLFRLPPVVLRGFILQPQLRLPRYALLFEKACSERA